MLKIGSHGTIEREIQPSDPKWGNDLPPLEIVYGQVTGIEWIPICQRDGVLMGVNEYHFRLDEGQGSYKVREADIEVK